jgi:hypothetical protein
LGTHTRTKAHVKYLEWFCHLQASKAGRYKLENGHLPPKAHISEPVVADLMDHFPNCERDENGKELKGGVCRIRSFDIFRHLVKRAI